MKKPLLILLMLIPSVAQAQLASATVTPGSPGTAIPSDFGGISTFDITDNGDVMGNTTKGFNPIYRQLIKNLIFTGQGFIISSEDDDGAAGGATAAPTAAQVTALGQLYTDLHNAGYNVKFLPGVAGFCTGNATLATGYATSWLTNMPSGSMLGMVAGNEPDGPCGITYATYLSRFQTYSANIRALAGGSTTTFMAPQFGGQVPWNFTNTDLNSFINSESTLMYAAGQHWYSLIGPSPCVGGNATTANMLAAATSKNFITAASGTNISTFVSNAHAKGIKFRLSEMNSIDCSGTSGISDAFSAALWLNDALFNIANNNIDGVNIFSDEGSFYDFFNFAMTTGPYSWNANKGSGQLRPSYYGFLMFQEATQNGAKLIPCAITTSFNVTCWATIDAAGVVRVVINNRDQTGGNSSSNNAVSITIPGYGTGTLKLLSCAAVTCTSGVTYNGQTFDGSTTGAITGSPLNTQVTPSGNVYSFTLTTTQAALLTVSPVNAGTITTPGWHKILGSTLLGGTENVNLCTPSNFRGYAPQGAGGCVDLIGDPSSAIIDTKRNQLCLTGGGHNDYGFNDIICLVISQIGQTNISPTSIGPLVRVTNPSPPNTSGCGVEALPPANEPWPYASIPGYCTISGVSTAATFGPGTASSPDPNVSAPNSRHMYQGLLYVPSLDSGVITGGALNVNGNASTATWVVPMSTIDATKCGVITNVSGATPCQPQWVNQGTNLAAFGGTGTGTMTVYDPNTNFLWVYNSNISNALLVQSASSLTSPWIHAGNGPTGFGFRMVGVIDTDRDYFVTIGNNPPGDGISYWPLAGYTLGGTQVTHVQPTLDASCTNMMATWNALTSTTVTTNYVGAFYDPIAHEIVMWPGTGAQIWAMDTGTWTCYAETYGTTKGVDYPQDTDTENAPGVTGTFTRFGYFSSLDMVVLCNTAKADCWYWHRRRGNAVITH